MKARKINLRPYRVNVGRRDDGGKSLMKEYAVKESLASILLSPQLRLTGQQLFDRRPLYEKIKNGRNELLLDDSEYEMLRNAVARFQGGGPNEIELIARVFEAEEIEVEERKKK